MKKSRTGTTQVGVLNEVKKYINNSYYYVSYKQYPKRTQKHLKTLNPSFICQRKKLMLYIKLKACENIVYRPWINTGMKEIQPTIVILIYGLIVCFNITMNYL